MVFLAIAAIILIAALALSWQEKEQERQAFEEYNKQFARNFGPFSDNITITLPHSGKNITMKVDGDVEANGMGYAGTYDAYDEKVKYESSVSRLGNHQILNYSGTDITYSLDSRDTGDMFYCEKGDCGILTGSLYNLKGFEFAGYYEFEYHKAVCFPNGTYYELFYCKGAPNVTQCSDSTFHNSAYCQGARVETFGNGCPDLRGRNCQRVDSNLKPI